ncbi:MAG: ROK family transcriptional regulator [Nitratireductor sp.]|nr:ROK family transcriptional regulator [Nitratireductor sp.]
MSAIARSDDLRRQNQRRILAALRRGGPLSRTELSSQTGLSASTVTAITALLMTSGALIETVPADSVDHGSSRRGRPQVSLSFNADFASIAAISYSLNRISAAIVDYAGRLRAEQVIRIETRKSGSREIVDAISLVLDQALAEAGTKAPLMQIAIGVQGVVDVEGRTVLWTPIQHSKDVPLAAQLETRHGAPVTLANDCSMIAEALRWQEPSTYSGSFGAVLLSHGIGMGLVLKGRLFSGIGSSATEFGHMNHMPLGAACRCGSKGCIEAYAGDYGIWRNANGLPPSSAPKSDLQILDMKAIADKARAGDGPERAAYRAAGLAIGSGLKSMFALFDPFPVAFAGSGAAAFDLMEDAIREALGEQAIGMATPNVEMHCYRDEYPLVRHGATMSALTSLDEKDLLLSDPSEKSAADLEENDHRMDDAGRGMLHAS